MEETCSKLNSTLKIVINFLQQPDRVPATQPCTVASAIGYRVYRPCTSCTALYTCFSNWLQSVVPTGYWLHSLVHSTTGYRVYRPGTGYTALYTQQLVTECTDQILATQPCIVVSTATGYTALYSCFNNWF